MDIQAAQAELMRRRAANNAEKQPVPLAERIELHLNEQEKAYWLALDSGSDFGDLKVPAEVITGRRELWNAFDDERHPDLQRAVKKIKVWYNDLIPVGGGIILAGGYGCGKTHLAKAIKQLRGPNVVMWSENDLVAAIQDTYSGNGSSHRIIRDIFRAELFIFDDLGAYQTSNIEFIQRVYLDLFDARCDEGKAFMITTNLDDSCGELIDRVGGRVYSRIMGAIGKDEYYLDLFDVPDYRLRNFKR
jgi:DNA replication protein DnaC